MAASSSGIRAGRAFIEIFAKNNASKELAKIAAQMQSLGDSIFNIGKKTLGVGAAITAPLLVAAQRFAAMGSEINDAAARTGLGVIAVQELGYAAEQTGASFEDVEGAVKRMQKTVFEATTGSKSAAQSLRDLGLSITELRGKKPEEQFEMLAEKISAIDDPMRRNALAMEIFGKSGTKLIPMMAELATQRAKLKALGAIMSAEDVALADEFGDTLDDLWKQIKAIVAQVGAAVAQAIMPFAQTVKDVLRRVIDWTRENRGLVMTVFAVGAAILAAGGALVGLGLSIKLAGFALSGVATLLSTLGTAIGFLMSPIGLVAAAVVGLVATFVYASGNGGKLMNWLGERFTALKEIATAAFGGIADALAAGDIALAAEILWTALKLAWTTGTQGLQNLWSRFKAGFVQTAVAAFYGVLDIWATFSASFQRAIVESTSFFVSLWHKAIHEVTKLFDGLEEKERARGKAQIDAAVKAGKITAAEGERLKANVDAQADQVKAARDKADADTLAGIEAEKQARIAAINDEERKTLEENAKNEQAISAAAEANANKEIADLQKKKEELAAKLKEIRERASAAREDREQGPPPLVALDEMQELNSAVNRGVGGPKSAGVFNVAALQSLQASPLQAQIKNAAQDTAKNTGELVDLVKNAPGVTFV